MSSFTCPHFDGANDYCLLLKTDCVPGRRGCVLKSKSVFAISAEERVRAKEAEKQAARVAPATRRRDRDGSTTD